MVQQWRSEPEYSDGHHKITMVTMSQDRLMEICEKSALHGADFELDACCEWLSDETLCESKTHRRLRAARRPKPPSLKEQAMDELDGIAAVFRMSHGGNLVCDKIRRALEALPND
jgi:hypothetical protein